jgi:CDP-paratose 2-epimerase
VLGRAVGDGERDAGPRVPRANEPARRVSLLRARAARRRAGVFLSTSRVDPVAHLSALAYEEAPERFELLPEQDQQGASDRGIAEDFPLDGARTLYGSTKLAAELLLAEYAAEYDIRTVIDRFGVVAGPWQMGKVDQGVFTYWMLAHYFGRPLRYVGFGGSGKQVRDLLHVDVVDLVEEQLRDSDAWRAPRSTPEAAASPRCRFARRRPCAAS